MKRILCPTLPKPGSKVALTENEGIHATRVLRLGEGDLIEALDGSGRSVLARLRLRASTVWLEFESEGRAGFAAPRVTIEMAVLKGEAMEWVVEKAVELNAVSLVPVLTAHTVVQMKSKGPEAFQERWQKIADQALKQCGRLSRMEVALPVSLEELFVRYPQNPRQLRLWCDEAERERSAPLLSRLLEAPEINEVRVLIGPEGGWSREEREFLTAAGLIQASLGPLVLRAETAGIYAMSLISGVFDLRSRAAEISQNA